MCPVRVGGSGYGGDTNSARYTHLVHTLMVWQVVPTHGALATTRAPMHQHQLTCLRLGCNGATRQQRRRAWRGERGWVEPRGLELAVQRLRVTRKDEHDASSSSSRDKQPSRAHTALLPSNSASGVLNESWRFNANFRSPHEWSFLGFPGLAATTKANGGQHVTQYPAYPSHTQPATRITNPLDGQRRHPDTRTGCDQ